MVELNDDEYHLFMTLRIGYCYVWCVKQDAWLHFSEFRLHEAS